MLNLYGQRIQNDSDEGPLYYTSFQEEELMSEPSRRQKDSSDETKIVLSVSFDQHAGIRLALSESLNQWLTKNMSA